MSVPPVRFLEPNLTDSATLAASSEVATLPVANLAHPLRRKVWRTENADSVHTVTADFGAAESVSALALTSHNLTREAKIRLEGHASNSWGAPAFTTGWIDAWESLFGYGQGGYGEHGYGGYLLDGEAEGYIHTFVHFIAPAQHFRWWRLTIDDIGNPDGYIEAGRLFLGSYFEPERGFGYDYQVYQADPSVVGYSLGQAPWSSAREKYFRVVLPFTIVETEEFYHRFGDMLRRVGTTRDLFLVLLHDPGSTPSQLLRFYGRFERLPEWSVVGANRGRMRIELRESR